MGRRRRWRDGRGQLIVRKRSGERVITVPLEISVSYRARTKGLLGRETIDGAMLLSPASGVHTFGMSMPIDVAYLDRRLTVVAVHTMRPGRLGRPRLRARHVLEAEAGAMARWALRTGMRVEVGQGVRETDEVRDDATGRSAGRATAAETRGCREGDRDGNGQPS
ncbi:hypothetical protein LK07_22410 [Streptomyces pluripotens]|uniref:DUF192 domain-containing protein n=1 Tax=Streptomyces pluripotens TaxID=1355015 RepID=A0A221P2D0_9ACTN|nr:MULTISPECIES: DUF192 domain-containing protein [Streptomyces]ARP72056.1 hypothetical protein LK06_021255 [Streptomyces pluripotens]ASN26304.1 hypothetical protein LK07_22410 [Streptomyces pluripotens]MCH0555914.1 DUF192 domain-containing protein [Streptomyces sp. MUM 16J]